MAERSIFFEEWRRCLQEHYRHVIRNGDSVTERTLVPVLHRVGFSDDDLRQLYLEATMRADLLAPGVVIDANKLPFTVHPAECTCAACMDKALEAGHDSEGQPLAAEPEPVPEPIAAGNVYAAAKFQEVPDMVEEITVDAVPEIEEEVTVEAVLEEMPVSEEITVDTVAEIEELTVEAVMEAEPVSEEITVEALAEAAAEEVAEEAPKNKKNKDDKPKQMSMF